MDEPTAPDATNVELPENSAIAQVLKQQAPQGSPAGRARCTRSAVASILNVSVTTVRRFEGTLLHPVKGEDGIHLFDPVEVEELAGRRPTVTPAKNSTAEGEVAAAAFALFKKKTSPRDVVIELEQSPALIQKLHEDWERLDGRLVLGEEVLGLLDRMLAARLIDEEVVSAINNNSADGLRAYIDEKLDERRHGRR